MKLQVVAPPNGGRRSRQVHHQCSQQILAKYLKLIHTHRQAVVDKHFVYLLSLSTLSDWKVDIFLLNFRNELVLVRAVSGKYHPNDAPYEPKGPWNKSDCINQNTKLGHNAITEKRKINTYIIKKKKKKNKQSTPQLPHHGQSYDLQRKQKCRTTARKRKKEKKKVKTQRLLTVPSIHKHIIK